MKPWSYLILSATLMAGTANAETLFIPQGAETRENVGGSAHPFSAVNDAASQQTYPTTLFPAITPGQSFQIDGLAFRLSSAGSFQLGASASFDRVEVLISSRPGPFTPDWVANHGANQLVVFDGPLSLSSTVPAGTTPSVFDLAIDFENPFLFDPQSGSLIVEIRKYDADGLNLVLAAAQIPGACF